MAILSSNQPNFKKRKVSIMTVSVLCFDEIKSWTINFRRANQLPVQASCAPKMQHYAHFAKKKLVKRRQSFWLKTEVKETGTALEAWFYRTINTWVSKYRISSNSFLPWIVSSPWIVSNLVRKLFKFSLHKGKLNEETIFKKE